MTGSLHRRADAPAIAIALVALFLAGLASLEGVSTAGWTLSAPSSGGRGSIADGVLLAIAGSNACAPRVSSLSLDACDQALGEGGIGRSLRGGVLADFLQRVRGVAPYARVTSTFYEPRPGRYHNGYDVGLDAGTAVPCGWAGRVTRITPWYGCETGITVMVNGVEVTYGHLVPAVKLGDTLAVGDVVGHVCYNHVDVKMFARNEYIDYAVRNPFLEPALTELDVCASATLDVQMGQALRAEPRVTYQNPPG